MKFRTELHPLPLKKQLTIQDKILLVGSCFSSSIGQKLLENKFDVLVNPFGVLFNPLSIYNLLEWTMTNTMTDNLRAFYVQHDDVWYNFHLHSALAHLDKTSLEKSILDKTQQTRAFLEGANVVILTLGTSFLYLFNQTPIANCHKQAQQQFEKKLIDLNELYLSLKDLLQRLSNFGTPKQIILTVSPVRHLKEGFVENATSKSLLKVLCHQLSQEEHIAYFPSYELLLDDLRDYRFYDSDLLHPSAEAIDYIWEKFVGAAMDLPTQALLKKWQKLRISLNHKPFFAERESHQIFLKNLLDELQNLPQLDVQAEIEEVKRQLVKNE